MVFASHPSTDFFPVNVSPSSWRWRYQRNKSGWLPHYVHCSPRCKCECSEVNLGPQYVCFLSLVSCSTVTCFLQDSSVVFTSHTFSSKHLPKSSASLISRLTDY